ncbi:MAG: 30S ribosomal protein S16 [Flavobacteriales bacterium]|nr:30S ribosomal protein S16 [Flavobacteriales bacterium]
MATKIRLARHGKKGKPFYHIVTADARAPRDGKYIERIGSYNPNTNPATIEFNFDRALHWVSVGAQPTDTVRAMLSYRGVLYKNHLLNGVKKGALTEAQVEEKFNKWLEDKAGKIDSKVESLEKDAKSAYEKAIALEKEKSNARAAVIAEANQAAEAAAAAETQEAEAATEETATEEVATEEAPKVEAATEETPKAEEAKEENKSEEETKEK